MNNIPEIESRLAGARADLSAALERGDDTVPFRTKVLELENELSAAKKAENAAERSQQRAEQERLGALSADAVRNAQNAVADAAGADVVSGVAMPAVIDDPAVANAAARLAAARDRLAREEATYQSHNGKYITLKNRLTDKERTRDAILARRVTGDEKPGDAAEVALLAEDISSLKELVADAHRNAEQYRPATSRRMVADAETELKKAQYRGVFLAKQARLQELERVFLAAHAEMVEAGIAVGERNKHAMFRASQELRTIAYGTTGY
ncbi:hypothetical protein MZ16F84_40740 [Escherichia coli]|uniref:hypothetical protein n=1 Tax=Escherichia coli TaxID=562 RepID=UPI003965F498